MPRYDRRGQPTVARSEAPRIAQNWQPGLTNFTRPVTLQLSTTNDSWLMITTATDGGGLAGDLLADRARCRDRTTPGPSGQSFPDQAGGSLPGHLVMTSRRPELPHSLRHQK